MRVLSVASRRVRLSEKAAARTGLSVAVASNRTPFRSSFDADGSQAGLASNLRAGYRHRRRTERQCERAPSLNRAFVTLDRRLIRFRRQNCFCNTNAKTGIFRQVAYYRWSGFNITEVRRPESVRGIKPTVAG
jgi:hypothetical protein